MTPDDRCLAVDFRGQLDRSQCRTQ